MNTRKELKILLSSWSNYNKLPINEAVGDTDGLLDQLTPQQAEALRNKVRQFFIFDKESFDIDEQVATKKDVIKTILIKNKIDIPEDHIHISTNLAKSTTGTSQGIIKGTSGKSTPAEQIALSRPDAGSFIIYDNLSRGLGEVEKGLARAAKNSSPELKAKLAQMEELSKTSVAYKKLDAEVKAAVAGLNIQTMKVGEGGESTEVHGAASSKGGPEFKSGLRGWLEARNLVYQTILKGTGALILSTHPEFKKIVSNYPYLAYIYNDMKKFTSSDTDIKKGDIITSEESPRLSSVPDIRTLYIAPLLNLDDTARKLSAEAKALAKSGDATRAAELEAEVNSIRSEMNSIGIKLLPSITNVKKELVSCLNDMKSSKKGEAYTFKLGQGEQTAPETGPEAEVAPTAPETVGEKHTIKIFDFDGTLFDTRDSFKSAEIQNEWAITFFMSYLNPEQKKIALKKMATSMKPLQLSKDLKNDPENSYIISSVSSPGFDKDVDYFASLLAKKNEDLRKFLTVILGKSLVQLDKMLYSSNPSEPEEPSKPQAAVKKPVQPQVSTRKPVQSQGTSDAALDDNEEDSLSENKIKKVKSLKEQLSGLKFRLGNRK